MPSVSISNFENDELISSRLLSFMNNHESSLTHSEVTGNGNKFTSSPNFGAPLTDLDVTHGSNLRSPLHRNGSTHSMATLQERVPNGSPNECNTNSLLVSASSPGLISGSCTPPPPTSVLPSASVSGNFLPVRGHGYTGAPPYSALTSPCLGSKAVGNAGMNHMLSYNGTSSGHGECHSLQNSPFYNHNPMNTGLQRQLGGISPASVSGMLPNGVNHLTLGSRGGGLYTPENTAYTLNNMRPLNASVCPQRELFPASPMSNQTGANGQSIFGAGLLMQERLRWYELAQKHGFIVGPELERVKENSCRSTSQSYGRIAAHFRNRYGETEAKTKAAYLQIGVRVPSKDHVSEIVGKGG
ncbi:RNA binding protein MEX3B [Fasciola hepatica]|uniref:RNA binding protein MEX3B n=1 Tax=Fasciola hepatica TaxID=6192 RepID=A0A4E0QY41_FASHE|nr:RNA binding protein MEX3B [Fasciola hepatica]THD18227.1 RNA binding protein MEX3B [Fasciola hepatica]